MTYPTELLSIGGKLMQTSDGKLFQQNLEPIDGRFYDITISGVTLPSNCCVVNNSGVFNAFKATMVNANGTYNMPALSSGFARLAIPGLVTMLRYFNQTNCSGTPDPSATLDGEVNLQLFGCNYELYVVSTSTYFGPVAVFHSTGQIVNCCDISGDNQHVACGGGGPTTDFSPFSGGHFLIKRHA